MAMTSMRRKRGNSEGTIRKRRDGRWEARIVLADGTRKSLYRKTRQEVARLLVAAMRDREEGLLVYTERQTFSQYMASWLDTVQHRIEPSTWMRYRRIVRRHLDAPAADVQLSKLTAQHIQALYARKLSDGVSATTVRSLHVILHIALEDAIGLGMLQRNVTERVSVPRPTSREMRPLPEEQAQILLRAATGHRFEALFVLALATGMRRGELLALKWCDVDLEGAMLHVNATLQMTPNGCVRTTPKTKRSRRSIALSARVVDALRRHRTRQAEERERLGAAWTDLDLVFPNATGRMPEPSYFVRRQFLPLLSQAGLPRIRFHDLRHTAATLLLAHGINAKVVSELLGHSSISITLSVYGHVLPHMQQQAADTMDRLLWGSPAGQDGVGVSLGVNGGPQRSSAVLSSASIGLDYGLEPALTHTNASMAQ